MTESAVTTTSILPILSLWRREVVRFARQRSRVIGALGTPVVFWVLIGSGLRNSFKGSSDSNVNYLEYAFPGTIALIVLFTAIFSMISVIEDRREGFLQAVLVAPVGRSAIVMGKVLGCSTLAIVQAAVFLLLAPLIGVSLSVSSVLAMVGVLVVVSVGLSALGLLIAWPMDSTQGFHAVMNLVLMPMWLLSGAFFPAAGASRWMGLVMAVNPLTYGVSALRHALYTGTSGAEASPSWGVSIGVSIAFALVMISLSVAVVTKRQ